jgi:hypothetical protein
MSDAPVPARAGASAPAVATADPRKLDDVLLAMDVVDTLRHRERLVDMELNAQAREEQLVARLKEIYGAQGIEVPEKILKDGVKALEEQRFVYKPPENSFSVKMAKLYVRRKHWLPAATTFTGAVIALVVGWQVLWAMPQAAEWNSMPGEFSRVLKQGQDLAVEPAVDADLASVAAEGQRAIANDNHGIARKQLAMLKDMNEQLALDYNLRIVSRQGEDTGFARQSRTNPQIENFYILVEGVSRDGRVLKVPVTNEETQTTKRVTMWAQRVTEETFDRIVTDKKTDLIVQNDILGRKERGYLKPTFDMPVAGGAITDWEDD